MADPVDQDLADGFIAAARRAGYELSEETIVKIRESRNYGCDWLSWIHNDLNPIPACIIDMLVVEQQRLTSALLELVEAKYYYNSRCTPYSVNSGAIQRLGEAFSNARKLLDEGGGE